MAAAFDLRAVGGGVLRGGRCRGSV